MQIILSNIDLYSACSWSGFTGFWAKPAQPLRHTDSTVWSPRVSWFPWVNWKMTACGAKDSGHGGEDTAAR